MEGAAAAAPSEPPPTRTPVEGSAFRLCRWASRPTRTPLFETLAPNTTAGMVRGGGVQESVSAGPWRSTGSAGDLDIRNIHDDVVLSSRCLWTSLKSYHWGLCLLGVFVSISRRFFGAIGARGFLPMVMRRRG